MVPVAKNDGYSNELLLKYNNHPIAFVTINFHHISHHDLLKIYTIISLNFLSHWQQDEMKPMNAIRTN